MKIAFDNDDVITRHPKFFSVLTKALIKDDNEVFIITDSDELFRHQIEKQLQIDNIRYHHLIITSKKEEFCKKNDIEFMVDDSYEYFKNSDNANIFVCAIK
jgi:hypothetical protein